MLIIYKNINMKIAENLHTNFTKIINLDKINFFYISLYNRMDNEFLIKQIENIIETHLKIRIIKL